MKRSKRKKGRKVAIQDARTHGEFVQNTVMQYVVDSVDHVEFYYKLTYYPDRQT